MQAWSDHSQRAELVTAASTLLSSGKPQHRPTVCKNTFSTQKTHTAQSRVRHLTQRKCCQLVTCDWSDNRGFSHSFTVRCVSWAPPVVAVETKMYFIRHWCFSTAYHWRNISSHLPFRCFHLRQRQPTDCCLFFKIQLCDVFEWWLAWKTSDETSGNLRLHWSCERPQSLTSTRKGRTGTNVLVLLDSRVRALQQCILRG